MTDEDLDRYYRHQDTGQHGDDGEPCPMPWWAIVMLVAACLAVGAVVYWVFV